MKDKEIIYERIHSDFLIRLCEGEFPLGSSIPSVTNLCLQYNVGKNTIIKVIQMLKDDGFIETYPSKVGQVLFDCNNLEQYLKDLPGFVCDKDILLDYYYAMQILFPSLFLHASLSYKEEQFSEIEKIVQALHSCDADGKTYINLSIKLSTLIVSSSENSLMKKTLEIVMRKTMLPGLLLIENNDIFKPFFLQVANEIELLYVALRQKNRMQLKACWKKILIIHHTILEKALILGIFPNNLSTCVTNLFQMIDAEKSFIIAADFREQILKDKYTNGDLLPSISQATKTYQVSVITMRRAYYILGEMGFTQTINGRGTEVVNFYREKHSDFLEQTAIHQKEYYLDAIEFLEITCEDIVKASVNISFSKLRRDINGQWNFEHRYSVLVIIYYLFKSANSPAVFSIYELINHYLYWCHNLKGIPATGELHEINHLKSLEIIDILESGNLDEAISILLKLLKTLYPNE